MYASVTYKHNHIYTNIVISTGNTFWMNKEKFTRAGFEPATSVLTCQRSTN